MISGEVVLLIIITLINLILWAAFFIRLRRNLSPQALLSDIKNEVEKLLIEINRTSLDNITLVQDKTNELTELIDHIDKKMNLLQGQEESKKREKNVLDRLQSNKPELKHEKKALDSYRKMSTPKEDAPLDDNVQLSIDFDSYNKENSVELEAGNSVEMTMPEIKQVEKSPLQEIPFKEKVLHLAKKDFSSDYIAHTLGCTVTEVQLVIDLYL